MTAKATSTDSYRLPNGTVVVWDTTKRLWRDLEGREYPHLRIAGKGNTKGLKSIYEGIR